MVAGRETQAEQEVTDDMSSGSAEAVCAHIDAVDPDLKPAANGCVECLASGGHWVHLRLCLNCGHVGCCDSSPGHHATKHAHATSHPLIRSYEPGEDWWYCYTDDVVFEVDDDPFAGLHH
jgi:uncharacterized UBP type Zn finger protein